VGAILVYVRPDRFGGPVRRAAVRRSVALALSLVVIPLALGRFHFSVDVALTAGVIAKLALVAGGVAPSGRTPPTSRACTRWIWLAPRSARSSSCR
jgi:hypothetical protein